ncbi:MAG: shikimate dehydrogenase, partial [Chlamydiae bacterium]|nr:shikimate dehydrogenase [Chlamydiota bacterium]
MWIASLSDPEYLKNRQASWEAVELRLDLFCSWNIEEVKRWKEEAGCPMVVTLRPSSQGGKFTGSEAQREKLLLELLQLQPAFMDIEITMGETFLQKVFQKAGDTKIILSYHDFERVPQKLDELMQTMQKYPAYAYKLAALVNSTTEAMALLLFGKQHPKASVICMGEKGAFARVLGPCVGNVLNYAAAGEGTAPGQPAFDELENIYKVAHLTTSTALYGLIGDPVAKSRGHIYHNEAFEKNQEDGLYVKMQVEEEELPTFFPLAKALGFKGLSVTMPLKEKVFPFVEEVEPSSLGIGALNTLKFYGDKISGMNTDGIGALDAIEKRFKVEGKTLIVIGAGGAARAIVKEALLRGARVWVLNRTVERAQKLAEEFHCFAGGLGDFPERFDIVVHTTPDSMPIDKRWLQKASLAMDIVYVPKETLFLQEAKACGCALVYGEEMFYNQALAQRKF